MVILDHKLRGIGYLNVFKLQHEEELKHAKEHEKDQVLRIWYHGKEIGSLNATALINHCPFVRQLKAGVRTEEGVNFNSILMANSVNINFLHKKLPLSHYYFYTKNH